MEQEARKRQRGLVVAHQGGEKAPRPRGGTEEGRQEEARKERK